MVKKYGLLFLLTSIVLLSGCVITTRSVVITARVHHPPVVVVSDNPYLVVIPGTYVYYLETSDGDVFFFHGYWYRPYRNTWYRADRYNRTWNEVEIRHVPRAVVHLPPHWKSYDRDTPRVREKEVHSRWNQWERGRYREKRKWREKEPSRKQEHRNRYYSENKTSDRLYGK